MSFKIPGNFKKRKKGKKERKKSYIIVEKRTNKSCHLFPPEFVEQTFTENYCIGCLGYKDEVSQGSCQAGTQSLDKDTKTQLIIKHVM